MCFIHSASLVAEYLKTRGLYPGGSTLFRHISPNIVPDETVGKGNEDDDTEPIYTIVSYFPFSTIQFFSQNQKLNF